MFLHKLFGTTPGEGMQPKEILSYSVAGFGQNLICGIIGSYLMYFYTNAVGLSAMSVALLMLFARIFDACNDPIMGSIVDKTKTKWGKCRPYLLFTPIPIAILTVICFTTNLNWSTSGRLVYASITYVLWSVLYTIVDVPYWGLATAMTSDTNKRGIMLTVARLFCTLGAGLIGLIIPIITDIINKKYQYVDGTIIDGVDVSGQMIPEQTTAWMQDLSRAFLIMSIIIVVLAIPTFMIGFKNTKERFYDENAAKTTLKHNLSLLFKNKPLMLIVLSGILGSAKIVFTYTGIYFATYNIPLVLKGESFLGMTGAGLNTLITMSIVPGGLIASLMVPYFTKKFGKRDTYIWSHIGGGLVLLAVFFVGWDEKWKLIVNLIALVIIGIPSGFANIITYAMIGDTVDYLEYTTGERGEGICFAMQTFINKIGMAVGAFLALIALSIADINLDDPSSVNLVMTKDRVNVIYIISILVCAISNILTAIPFFFYKFTEKEQARVVEITRQRNEEKKRLQKEALAENSSN